MNEACQKLGASPRWGKWGAGALLALALAVPSQMVSSNLYHRFHHRQESMDFQLALMKGQPYTIEGRPSFWPMFQNRILFPFALTTATERLGFRLEPSFLMLTLIFMFLDYFLLWNVFTGHLGATEKTAAAALLALAAYRTLTFDHGWEHGSDYLETSLMCYYAVLAWEKRWLPLLLVGLLGSANRESSTFAGLMWIVFHGWAGRRRIDLRQIAAGVLFMATFYAAANGIRIATLGYETWRSSPLQGTDLTGNLLGLVTSFGSTAGLQRLSRFGAFWAPVLAWLWWNRRSFGRREERFFLAALAVLSITFVFALVFETRTLLAPMALFLLTAVSAEAASLPRSTVALPVRKRVKKARAA